MTTIKYLSPTSLRQFETNPKEFVLQRIHRGPRLKQTVPMAVGSIFDQLIKDHLTEQFGLNVDNDSGVEVKGADLDEATKLGVLAFDNYLTSRECDSLMARLRRLGKINMIGDYTANIGDVPVRGKPDLEFGSQYILDWKVNGFCSSASPVAGYVGHKDYSFRSDEHGNNINMERPLVEKKPEWVDQVASYHLQLGHKPPFLIHIHQLTHRNGKVKVVEHCEVIPIDHVEELIGRYARAWSHIKRGHYFTHLSKAESDKLVEQLGESTKAFEGEDDKDKWYRQMMGR